MTPALLPRVVRGTRRVAGRAVRRAIPYRPVRHSLPVFEGEASRAHGDRTLWELRGRAAWARLTDGSVMDEVETFVQFAGFPRSGHSLVGCLLDAHPRAVVSHELDAMGLLHKGLSLGEVLTLARMNSAEFQRNGRYWNGLRYEVEGGHGGRADPHTVVGDKKGDWAVRWCMEEPGLLERFARMTVGLERRWILIVRNPFDNVAAMSLSAVHAYDRLRIACDSSSEFRSRLEEEKGQSITDAVLDEKVRYYGELCEGVAAMKERLPEKEWHEVRHDRFVSDPTHHLSRILDFVGLPAEEDFLERCGRLVRNSTRRRRDDLAWTPAQRDRVEALVDRFDFLSGYSFDG